MNGNPFASMAVTPERTLYVRERRASMRAHCFVARQEIHPRNFVRMSYEPSRFSVICERAAFYFGLACSARDAANRMEKGGAR